MGRYPRGRKHLEEIPDEIECEEEIRNEPEKRVREISETIPAIRLRIDFILLLPSRLQPKEEYS